MENEITSYEKKSEVMKKISQFILNAEIQDIRLELYDHLIFISLQYEDNRPKTVGEIQTIISNEIGVEKFPLWILNERLPVIKEKKYVHSIHEGNIDRFYLSEDKKGELNEYSKQTDRLKEIVSNEIQIEFIRRHPNSNEKMMTTINSIILDIMSSIFSEYGEYYAYAMLGKELEIGEKERSFDFQKIINDSLSIIDSDRDRDILIDFLSYYLENPSENLSKYCYILSCSYYLAEMLSIDPECRLCIKESFSKKTILLDTNIIMTLLNSDTDIRNTITEIFKRTSSLGTKICFTSITKREFERVIKSELETIKDTEFKNLGEIKKILELISPYDSNFFAGYIRRKKDQFGLTFKGYCETVSEIEDLLKKKYGIEFIQDSIRDIVFTDIESSEEINNILSVWKINKLKTGNIAKHDSFHFLLIQKLRTEEDVDIFGPNSWFLTRDSFLEFCEFLLLEQYKVQSSTSYENWAQFISLVNITKFDLDKNKDLFIKLFSSRFVSLAYHWNSSEIKKLIGHHLSEEDLTPSRLKKILYNKSLKELLKKVRKSSEPEIVLEKNIDIIQPIMEDIRKDFSDQLEMERNKRKELEKKIASFPSKIATLEEETRKIKPLENKLKKLREIKKRNYYSILAMFCLTFLFLDLYLFNVYIFDISHRIGVISIEVIIVVGTKILEKIFADI